MPEVLWWRKESWYEAKSIPLFGFFLSPRQVIFLLFFTFIGFLIQFAIPLYYAKIAVVFVFATIGGFLSSFPTNTVPWELALIASLFWHEPVARAPPQPKQVTPEVQQLKPSIPLTLTGALEVEKPTEVALLVDGVERARTVVTKDNPRYRLYYIPEESEKGAHELTIVAEGRTIEKLVVEVS